ncbi:MAG: acyl--CoA ligase [Elusimicrobia bacterium]|nr:acyl--CoA ligase [Elusimicrobiota bacterium]
MATLHGHLIRQAANKSRKTFLRDASGAWTFSDVDALSNRLARVLVNSGFKSGSRLGIFYPNGNLFALAHFAAMKIGGVSAPMDPGLRSKNLSYILNFCDITHVITTLDLWEANRYILGNRRIFLGNPPAADKSLPPNVKGLLESASTQPHEALPGQTNDALPAAILFTSGTTGNPRGVVLTHRNLEAAAQSIIKFTGLGPDDKEMIVLPLTHLFGLGHLHVNTINGATAHIERNLMEPIEILKKIKDQGVTSFPGVPTGYSYLMDRFAPLLQESSKTLSKIILNSTAMPHERIKKLRELLPNTRLFMYYGLTEASRASFICYNDVPDPLWRSVGRASPGVNIKIVAPNFKPILAGQEGEIVVNGSNVMKEYLNDPEATQSTLTPEGLRTGDLGYMNDDGYLFLTGRLKDMINVGGSKLNPCEVEEVLARHNAVSETAVVGIPDPHGIAGERVKAYIVPKEGQTLNRQEIMEFCSKHLETYKIPQIIEFCERLPRTDSGKLRRVELKK